MAAYLKSGHKVAFLCMLLAFVSFGIGPEQYKLPCCRGEAV